MSLCMLTDQDRIILASQIPASPRLYSKWRDDVVANGHNFDPPWQHGNAVEYVTHGVKLDEPEAPECDYLELTREEAHDLHFALCLVIDGAPEDGEPLTSRLVALKTRLEGFDLDLG